jgi:nitroimidazol reductase NimA-like FMN-containing flavoprotein (pyridoxamine 5'-phosphate oxidase superfamily)
MTDVADTTAKPPSARVRVRRLAKRGVYEERAILDILDEALICHVGFVDDDQPYVLPIIHGRIGSTLYFHGSQANRMLGALSDGIDVCVTATIIDGLVLARSAFHHSMNYRSVVILGRATAVTDDDEKTRALEATMERLLTGRWADARQPNEKELAQTLVVSLPVDEASAKVRTGPPLDDEEDYALPVWAGVRPLSLTPTNGLVPDPRLPAGVDVPAYLR